MREHVLIIQPDDRERESTAGRLRDWGYRVCAVADMESAGTRFKGSPPALVLMDADMSGTSGFLEEFGSLVPKGRFILICDPHNAERTAMRFGHLAPEFALKPVKPVFLRNALDRAAELVRLGRELKHAKDYREAAAKPAKEIAETERFLAVRQIVDKMSLFIAKLAKEAQGGIRYFNEMPYFVSIHDQSCRVLAQNLVFKNTFGSDVRNSWDIYAARWRKRKKCPVGRTLETNNVMTAHAVVRYSSGATVPVIVHTAPIFNNEGRIELILEVFAGTREIEQLAREIETTQQRYEQLFDAVPSYVVVLDLEKSIAAANRRYKEVFGDRTGGKFFDHSPSETTSRSNDLISKTLKDGRPHRAEMVLHDSKGLPHNVMAWTSPIKTPAGKLVQILVIFADITELRKLRDNLSSLGLMISALSHDLKGTLTGLDAGLYMIDSGFYRDKPARIEEGLDVARLMAERIRKVVYDILYYSKERELELESVEIRQFAGDVAANIETRIIGANISFRCDFAFTNEQFEIDVGLVRSALTNILENAMEACIEDTTEKWLSIDFTVRPDGDDALFEIVDNAGGMDQEQIKSMFNLFYSTKGRKGTGLGMFIAKNVIKRHGGRIWVDSNPGAGTHFRVRIPMRPMWNI